MQQYFYRTHFAQSKGHHFPEKTKFQKIYGRYIIQDPEFDEKHPMKNHIRSFNSSSATKPELSRKLVAHSQYFQLSTLRPKVMPINNPFIPPVHDSSFRRYPEVKFKLSPKQDHDKKKNNIFRDDDAIRQRVVAKIMHSSQLPKNVLVSEAPKVKNVADNTVRIRWNEDNGHYLFNSNAASTPLSVKINQMVKSKLASISMASSPDKLKHGTLYYLP